MATKDKNIVASDFIEIRDLELSLAKTAKKESSISVSTMKFENTVDNVDMSLLMDACNTLEGLWSGNCCQANCCQTNTSNQGCQANQTKTVYAKSNTTNLSNQNNTTGTHKTLDYYYNKQLKKGYGLTRANCSDCHDGCGD